MKENIEEDIEILEHIKMGIKADTQAPNVNIRNVAIRKFEAIEHILSDYKRVLKENEELKADNYELNNIINDLLDSIPTQKVKDKIEELKKKSGGNVFHIQQTINAEIRLLQDLLEEKGNKMCEYCKAEIYFKTRKIMKSLLAPATHIEELRQELEDKSGEMYIKIPNLYCPICGRKLKEDK